MKPQASKKSLQFGMKDLLITMAIVAVLFAIVHYLRKPIRDAKQIRPGDTVSRVHEILGTPTAVFASDVELRRSYLAPMSFVFTDLERSSPHVPVAGLPVVSEHAEWFEYSATAGHLVYFDQDRVAIVFWGGT